MIPKVTSPPVVRAAATAYRKKTGGSPAPATPAHQVVAGFSPGGRPNVGAARRMTSNSPIASAPGAASHAGAAQIVPAAAAIAATSSGPAKAPTWSRALCMPKPRPSPTSRAASANRALLEGERTAFPARSARIISAANARPAAPRCGATASKGTQSAVSP